MHCNEGLIPIVRTTTNYNVPAHNFLPVHHNIIEKLNCTSGRLFKLNNAMIERYNYKYVTMKDHSDQDMDLDPESYICVFSCYNVVEGNLPA